MFHAAKYGIPRDMTKGMFLIRPAKIPKPHRDSPHTTANATTTPHKAQATFWLFFLQKKFFFQGFTHEMRTFAAD